MSGSHNEKTQDLPGNRYVRSGGLSGSREVSDFGLAEPRAQVALGRLPFHQWTFPNGMPWTDFYRQDSGYLLRFAGLADYEVSADGRGVSCHPVPGVSEETTRHLYLNQVLPLALSRLGKLVFHASAVDVRGSAAAFVGEAGRGKSTLAASFAASEYPFLTDDGLVIEEDGGNYWVAPSHPSIRLWEDSTDALVRPDTPSVEPLGFTSKIRFLAAEDMPHCDELRPLCHVYFLGTGVASHVAIEPMSASEALIELVKHSFLLDIQASEFVAAHFDRLSRLVARRIYFRLDYPRKFELLPHVRDAVLRHCGS